MYVYSYVQPPDVFIFTRFCKFRLTHSLILQLKILPSSYIYTDLYKTRSTRDRSINTQLENISFDEILEFTAAEAVVFLFIRIYRYDTFENYFRRTNMDILEAKM